jgi:uncharacterized protein YacL
MVMNARITAFALAVGLIISACGFGVDHLFHHANRLYASDLYTLIVAFVMSYLLLLYEERRRRMLARRMEIAAEVNHHVRNALTAVVFSASVVHDPSLEAVLKDATARIDWVLNTVLPDGAESMKWPIQAPDWHPGTWQASGEAGRAKASEEQA